MSLAFMGLIIGLGFSKAQIAIGLLLMIVHPVGGGEEVIGALRTERYGGQIIKEIEADYCGNLGMVKPFEFHEREEGR